MTLDRLDVGTHPATGAAHAAIHVLGMEGRLQAVSLRSPNPGCASGGG